MNNSILNNLSVEELLKLVPETPLEIRLHAAIRSLLDECAELKVRVVSQKSDIRRLESHVEDLEQQLEPTSQGTDSPEQVAINSCKKDEL